MYNRIQLTLRAPVACVLDDFFTVVDAFDGISGILSVREFGFISFSIFSVVVAGLCTQLSDVFYDYIFPPLPTMLATAKIICELRYYKHN
jgi:hypothetical protein